MTWNPRDAIPRSKGKSSKRAGIQPKKAQRDTGNKDEASFEPVIPPSMQSVQDGVMMGAMPTFASLDEDDEIMHVPDDVEHVWNTMGMLTDRQWDIWAKMCRRGIYEI